MKQPLAAVATPGARPAVEALRPEDRFLATHTITPRAQNSIPAHSHPPFTRQQEALTCRRAVRPSRTSPS